jgi:hypothetical protein
MDADQTSRLDSVLFFFVAAARITASAALSVLIQDCGGLDRRPKRDRNVCKAANLTWPLVVPFVWICDAKRP